MTSADRLSNACSKNKFTPSFTHSMPKRNLNVRSLKPKRSKSLTLILLPSLIGKKTTKKLQEIMKSNKLKESAKCSKNNGKPKKKKKKLWSKTVTFSTERETSLLLSITSKRKF